MTPDTSKWCCAGNCPCVERGGDDRGLSVPRFAFVSPARALSRPSAADVFRVGRPAARHRRASAPPCHTSNVSLCPMHLRLAILNA
jgi:hypothetical protein